MATVNTTITKAWTKIAENTADPFLASSVQSSAIEYATTAADEAPSESLVGHNLVGVDLAVIRSVIGPGFVWARISPRAAIAEATVVVSS